MIAHFIGGPLNGKERVVQEGAPPEIQAYEFPSQAGVPSWEREWPTPESIEYHPGIYRRVNLAAANLPAAMPAVYVWMDERPFRFTVTIDAVRGASRELARKILSEAVERIPHHYQAFQGGIQDATVEE